MNDLVSRLWSTRPTSSPGPRLYAAACALVEADGTYPGWLSTSDMVPAHAAWRPAVGGTPARTVVATVSPGDWKGRPVRLLSLAADQ